MSDLTPNDETRALWDELTRRSSVPADIVPGRGLTRDDLLAQDAAAGTWAEVTIPGEVVLSPETGLPIGFGEPTTETVYRGGSMVTHTQLAAAGLTPDDVPNLTVIDPPTARSN